MSLKLKSNFFLECSFFHKMIAVCLTEAYIHCSSLTVSPHLVQFILILTVSYMNNT